MTVRSGLEDLLVTLLIRRNEVYQDRVELEATLVLAGDPRHPAMDNVEFHQHMRQMRQLGQEIADLDREIDDIRYRLT
jgi:hypothetical protein